MKNHQRRDETQMAVMLDKKDFRNLMLEEISLILKEQQEFSSKLQQGVYIIPEEVKNGDKRQEDNDTTGGFRF